jgi:hypothetical protein
LTSPDFIRDGVQDDLLGRILSSETDPTDRFLVLLQSGRGRDALTRSVAERIGTCPRNDLSDRMRVMVDGAGQSLAQTMSGYFTLSSPRDAAVGITDLLYDQVERNISAPRIRPLLTALLTLLEDAPGVASSQRSPGRPAPVPADEHLGAVPETSVPLQEVLRQSRDRIRQADTRRQDPTRAASTAGTANRAEPEKGAANGFVLLKGPVSTSYPEGTIISAPLFPANRSGRAPGPVRVPAILPPPPDTRDGDVIRSWLRGDPVRPDMIGVSAGLLVTGEPGDLMEIEAEFQSDPVAALRIYKARGPVADGTEDAAWCGRLGRDLGRFTVTHEAGVVALATSLAAVMREQGEERIAPLLAAGANLTVREELAEAVCGLIDAEVEYVSDGPATADGPPQNLMGSFSPNADLRPGQCLDRAIRLHLVASVPFGTALRQSLTEFRIAQALRENPNAPFQALNDRFERDPALPLEELCGRVPIVRLGYTEPAF